MLISVGKPPSGWKKIVVDRGLAVPAPLDTQCAAVSIERRSSIKVPEQTNAPISGP